MALAVVLSLWDGWALADQPALPPLSRHLPLPTDRTWLLSPWLTAIIATRVMVGVVAFLLRGRLSRRLRWALAWLAAGGGGSAMLWPWCWTGRLACF